MSHVTTGTILDKILDQTARDVAGRQVQTSVEELRARGAGRPAPVSLNEVLSAPGMSVIAEIKRASPSRGVFPVEVDPATVAADYIAGGAAAISVLTDGPFFKGSLDDMEQAARVAHAAERPVAILRKDFLVDAYQVAEAWAYGADAVLLIVAALADDQLRELMTAVNEFGLEALVEVHDEAEMARAIAVGARNLGINNRDLHTFTVDLATTERLAPLAPEGAVVIGESGVFGPAEIERLWRAGAQAVLVGEGVIVQPDRAATVRALRQSIAV
ncbi:MAG: indole-3-glycerol phosphate synthase TrpC [Thermomicrobiales bacterium]|nr:indole-3-glycerol phosphate synthase TrpC [Thermomicrobiales bacterium]